MIFVTVGTQLPFDRLIKMVDEIAISRTEDYFAQVGQSTFTPANMMWSRAISPGEIGEYLNKCRLVISHAGIGTILSAQRYEKPIILVPRLASEGEHRNDHQSATCEQLAHLQGVYIARNKSELLGYLERPDLVSPDQNTSKLKQLRFAEQVAQEIRSL